MYLQKDPEQSKHEKHLYPAGQFVVAQGSGSKHVPGKAGSQGLAVN